MISRLNLLLTGAKTSAIRSWAFIALLTVLCAILAILQYRWIGEISVAEGDRLKAGLENSLRNLSRDFNSDISSTVAALMPGGDEEVDARDAYTAQYDEWLSSTRHAALFQRLGYFTRDGQLHLLDRDKRQYRPAPWPGAWVPARDATLARELNPTGGPGGGGPGGRNGPLGLAGGEGLLLIVPRFQLPEPPPPDGPALRLPNGPGGPGGGRPLRSDWWIAELDADYLRERWLPQLLEHHLGRGQYQAELVSRHDPDTVLLSVDASSRIGKTADASIGLFELTPDAVFGRLFRGRRGGGGPRGFFGRGPGGPGGPGGLGGLGGPSPEGPPMRGRWTLAVRHRAGSLDTIIQQARWRNLGVSVAVLGLVVATAGALIRYSRRAEKLAQLQMDFVAGISHELRTPLTVIRMAAFNLKGRIAQNPAQVEKYGTLIAGESERLQAIVEQVLRFASIESGKASTQENPVDTNDLIAHTLESCRSVIEHARVEVEQNVAPALPVVLGDNIALQHALQNLITNAVKYGTESSNWIGLSAQVIEHEAKQFVEIRVADRGPGIPAEEQQQLFDPFFRGRRAMQDQIHGTGLGLNLVKKIVEAHHGTVRVTSAPGKGTEFAIRIPVAPAEYQDEFAHSFG